MEDGKISFLHAHTKFAQSEQTFMDTNKDEGEGGDWRRGISTTDGHNLQTRFRTTIY